MNSNKQQMERSLISKSTDNSLFITYFLNISGIQKLYEAKNHKDEQMLFLESVYHLEAQPSTYIIVPMSRIWQVLQRGKSRTLAQGDEIVSSLLSSSNIS